MTPAGLVHNMSAPPRSQVRVAGGLAERRLLVVRLPWTCWCPDGITDFAALARELGVDPGRDATEALARATREALDRSPLPAAAAAVYVPIGEESPVDGLLALAVLSRTTGNLFFSRREPRFTRDLVDRRIGLVGIPGNALSAGQP